MVKYFSSDSIFTASWDKFSQVFWVRYPNPYSSHVLTEDVVNREVVNGKLCTTKILRKTNRLPKWGERLISSKTRYVYLVEESIVDPMKKTLVTYTRNIGLGNILSVLEKCHYKMDTRATTLCTREMWAESRLYGLRRPIEKFAIERFKKNVQNTASGLYYVLEKKFPSQPIPQASTAVKKPGVGVGRPKFSTNVFPKVESS